MAIWLDEVRRISGIFGAIPNADVLALLGRAVARVWGQDEEYFTEEFGALLIALALEAGGDIRWGRWLYCDDRLWNRQEAQRRLPSRLGVPPASAPTAGVNESLPTYVARCNATADATNSPVRWHEVAQGSEIHLFVATTNEDFDALVQAGLVWPR